MEDPTHKKELLVLGDVHAAYVKKEILRGVSLSVHRGEVVALLGGNGSGKSTTLKTIAGLLHPMKGQILFEGVALADKSVHDRQRMGIGYLLQGGRVFPNLTVAENLGVALQHARNGAGASQARVGMIFPLLAERTGDRAGLLSGGQRQMLAIEMVLIQKPKLALLDEPTGALSQNLANEILDHIANYVQETGCGILLVEQNVEEAKRVAHRSFTLVSGVIHPANVPAQIEAVGESIR